MSERANLRCRHCTDSIGVYEPLIVVRDGVPVRTSVAATGTDPIESDQCFHADCFASRCGHEEIADRL